MVPYKYVLVRQQPDWDVGGWIILLVTSVWFNCFASSIEIGFVVIMDWRINGRFRKRGEFVEMGSIYSLLYSFRRLRYVFGNIIPCLSV